MIKRKFGIIRNSPELVLLNQTEFRQCLPTYKCFNKISRQPPKMRCFIYGKTDFGRYKLNYFLPNYLISISKNETLAEFCLYFGELTSVTIILHFIGFDN